MGTFAKDLVEDIADITPIIVFSTKKIHIKTTISYI